MYTFSKEHLQDLYMEQKYCAQKLWGIWFTLTQTLQKDKCSQKQSQRVHLSKRDILQQLKITTFYLQISTLEDDYDKVRSGSYRFWFCQNQFSFVDLTSAYLWYIFIFRLDMALQNCLLKKKQFFDMLGAFSDQKSDLSF